VIRDNSDFSWAEWGKQNPYYAVLTEEKFRQQNLTDALKSEFFESGRIHIERVLRTAETQFGTPSFRKSALDFGCGVGRLVIPLAQIFGRVTGVDVSPAMLEEARANCKRHQIKNVDLVFSDDALSRVKGQFDFIHSCFVLQHIPVHRGEQILRQLLEMLSLGGILAVQFPLARRASIVRKSVHFLRRNIAPISSLVNVFQGKHWNEPFMQMNPYNMNRVLDVFAGNQTNEAFLELREEGSFLSAYVLAKKTAYIRKPSSSGGSIL
jgi:2-polyprenyl-3-methyl-5-hydroxy-6-metoxy-1,4-benzoquinol methylase